MKTFIVPVPYTTYNVFTLEAESLEDARRIATETPVDDLIQVLEFYKGGSDGEDHFAGIDSEFIEEA